MAKGAANEAVMAKLHNTLAQRFITLLEEGEENPELLTPAILSACAKFLKDNDVTFDTEEIAELSALEKRLEAKRKARPNFTSVASLPIADVH